MGTETPTKMFEDRMVREGKIADYRKRLKERMTEGGLWYAKARSETMKEFGYAGPKEERRIHEDWMKLQEAVQFREVAKQVRGIDLDERRIERFDEALECLPANASPSDEIAWVRAHPAMARKDQTKDKTQDVKITADDVLYAPHGKAPSRAAVNQLIYWANRPQKFYEGLLSEHKKTMDGDKEVSERRADVGLGEIQEYLDSLEEEAEE